MILPLTHLYKENVYIEKIVSCLLKGGEIKSYLVFNYFNIKYSM